MKRLLIIVTAILILLTAIPVVTSFPSLSSSSDDDNSSGTLFNFHMLVGNTPGVTVRGVPSAGAPWIVAQTVVQLDGSGRLHVNIKGLLLDLPGNPLDRTTGPVTGVQASLTCEGTNVVASTDVAPLSSDGNAKINEFITLPQSCVGPIVLIRLGSVTGNPGPLLGPWFAVTGF
jgi:hypothetical protein